ncbi:MAG: CDP-archaeol synthase [Deltaproteobacteria bacterium]|nr:CDP-archaeol synthase [Deltaproteobacteria bacterium]
MFKITGQILYLGSPIFLVAVVQGLSIKYEWFSSLKRPLDLGMSIKGKRIFGDHKTWRGMVINLVFCTLGAMIQVWLQGQGPIPPWLPLFDYSRIGLLVGVLMGLGLTLGELPNSFLKRQLGLSPGQGAKGPLRVFFFLFDQVDMAIGIWLLIFVLIRPTLSLVLYSLLLTLLLHVSVSVIGYFLGMRKTLV